MTKDAVADAIDDRIQRIEIDLMFLSNPHNLAANDGEFIGASIADSGLRKLKELQDLVQDKLESQKKIAPSE